MIELLIVVAIILIIAAIAIPNLLRARMAANEASAVGSDPYHQHFGGYLLFELGRAVPSVVGSYGWRTGRRCSLRRGDFD